MPDGFTSHLPDKRQVAASFSRAAESYDSVAELQRTVGARLLALLPADLRVQRWMDLGCGTGYFCRALQQRYPEAQGVALDIAEGMLQQARRKPGAELFLAADAESLPLQAAVCDLLFSSLAVQWCADLGRVLAEARRVLRPGGVLAFSSLFIGTLDELRRSWQAVDDFVHVNSFRSFEAYQRQIAESGLQLLELTSEAPCLYFPDLRSLTHELKALGAHNLNPGRPSGLTAPQRIRALRQAYESLRQPQGLPLTYCVIYGVLRRPH